MPHKMNTRSSERIDALLAVLVGHVSMAATLLGSQWNEGDVSRSATRRVVLPDGFFAIDGVLETILAVLDEFGTFPEVIDAELRTYAPFLASTRLLSAAVEAGMGREEAHAAIKHHLVRAAVSRRTGETPDIAAQIGADGSIPLSDAQVHELIDRRTTGAAAQQVARFCKAASEWISRYPDARNIRGEPIL